MAAERGGRLGRQAERRQPRLHAACDGRKRQRPHARHRQHRRQARDGVVHARGESGARGLDGAHAGRGQWCHLTAMPSPSTSEAGMATSQ
jgi:hypothetical protein